jgi:hypothetical protein
MVPREILERIAKEARQYFGDDALIDYPEMGKALADYRAALAPSAPRREDAFTRLPVRCRWDCPDPCPEHEAPTRVERTPAETMLRSWIDRRGSNYAAVEIPEWPELTGIINALLKESIAADDARRAAKGSKP